MVEFCGIAGVWVLIMKNHKIQPEELEFYEERDDEQHFSHVNLYKMNTKFIWMLIASIKNSCLRDQS